MIKILLVLFAAGLVGCGQKLNVDDLEYILGLCQGNGGVERTLITASNRSMIVTAYCKDGYEITQSKKRIRRQ